MSHRRTPSVAGSDLLVESPPNSRQQHSSIIVPRGQDRPSVSIARNREDVRQQQRTSTSRRGLDWNVTSGDENGLEDETSPTFPPLHRPPRTPITTSSTIVTTPANTPSFRSGCDHEMRSQLLQLQRQIATLTDKIDSLRVSSSTVNQSQRRNDYLPRDMVACVHKVVAKLKEKDPPIEWTLEPNNSFNDELNGEVTLAIERGVRATSAFKEADPVVLERSIRTYFKTLKARRKRASTQRRVEGLPEVNNKLEESLVSSRRNQRCHNKLKARKEALKQAPYSAGKKERLEAVMTIEYMSPEESSYDEGEDGRSPSLTKLIIRKFLWRSDELKKEFRSLDRKAYRAKSERGRKLMAKREFGDLLPGSLHAFPKGAPVWALKDNVCRSA